MSGFVTEVNAREIMLDNILACMSTKTFGKVMAAEIVGSKKRLTELIASGKIECIKSSKSKNCKWFCNAAQVLQHCRNMRNKQSKI